MPAAPAHPPSPFHPGEQAAQTRAGVRATAEALGRRMIRDFMPPQHRMFYAQLPFVVVAAVDAEGRPWTGLLAGDPGFVSTPDPRRMVIDARPAPGDPLADALEPGQPVGLLGIELHTRRRNRAAGRVRAGGQGIELGIQQAFGNCPQYIHPRSLRPPEDATPGPVSRTRGLAEAHRAMIRAADTFFIGSVAPGDADDARRGADASHRGGPAGFVAVDGDVLEFPDYAGNNAFNTIGNLLVDPRVGLVFVDFERGDLLQITGRAEIIWSGPALAGHANARRVVRVTVDEAVFRPAGLPLRLAGPDAQGWRPFRVEATVNESTEVRSFYLAPVDGGVAMPFAPGQHLTVRMPADEGPAAVRTYSLSRLYDGAGYRISVKREPHGRVSRWLHDTVRSGDLLEVREPSGDFALDMDSARPVLLLSAGVGVTPLIPMLQALAGGPRPTLFVHGARDGHRHAFRREVERLAARGARLHVRYSRPLPHDRLGEHHHGTGRIDRALLAELGVDGGYAAYLCGPGSFMADAHRALRDLGVPAEHIHAEDFGPAGA